MGRAPMKALPEELDPAPYAELLMKRLYRDCGGGAKGPLRAVTEAQWPIDGDDWAWTDDNAKVIELLTLPLIWQRWPEAVAGLLRFIRDMCDGPFIFRRIGAPRLERTDAGPIERGEWRHTMMQVALDLPAGMASFGLRFHDGRTARHMRLTGNYVQFTQAGAVVTIDAEDMITDCRVEEREGRLVAIHEGEARFVNDGKLQRLGRLRYETTTDQGTMLVAVVASLEVDPAATVENIVLTIGHDDLSHGGAGSFYQGIGVLNPDGSTTWHRAGDPIYATVPAVGAPYYSIVQDGLAGFALAIHSRVYDSARLKEIRAAHRENGLLHWVVAAYEFPGSHAGERLEVREDKLITAGGFYGETATYAALMDRAAQPEPGAWPRDYSISYDYGVEINAFAKAYAVLASGRGTAAPGVFSELRALTDRYLDFYLERFVGEGETAGHTVFSRQLAFVMMAMTTMLRATGEAKYHSRLTGLVDLLLRFEAPLPSNVAGETGVFLMGMVANRDVHVDCHAAAMLALVLAAPWVDDPRIAGAVERGLQAFELVTGRADPGIAEKADTIGIHWVDGGGNVRLSHAFWNFQAGLMLRLFRALRESTVPALVAVRERQAMRLAVMEPMLRNQLALAVREYPDGTEIRCSWVSQETNSETQPWCVLGLTGHPWD